MPRPIPRALALASFAALLSALALGSLSSCGPRVPVAGTVAPGRGGTNPANPPHTNPASTPTGPGPGGTAVIGPSVPRGLLPGPIASGSSPSTVTGGGVVASSGSVANKPAGASAPPQVIDPMEIIERQVGAAIARVRESSVALEYTAADSPTGARRVASGVVFSEDGDVLSVRIDAPPISADSTTPAPIVARVASGRRLPASWVAADPETGLTVLKIPPGIARPAIPAARGALLGLSVMVIGNPYGLGHSVSRGFVSGLNRRLEIGPRQIGGLFQIDAAIHPGDNGALITDLRGGWIGVIRSGLAATTSAKDRAKDRDADRRVRELDHDLGFAIPARDALWVATQLRDHQRVDRAYLGVTLDRNAPTPPGEPEGAVFRRVWADSPAELAGLKPGDRVVAIDGQPIRSPYDLTDHLDHTPAEADVTLDLLRGTGDARRYHRITLHSARRPPFEPSLPGPSVGSASTTTASTKDQASPPRPRGDDLQAERLPRHVAEIIERLEQRIADLERQKADPASATPLPTPASSTEP